MHLEWFLSAAVCNVRYDALSPVEQGALAMMLSFSKLSVQHEEYIVLNHLIRLDLTGMVLPHNDVQ